MNDTDLSQKENQKELLCKDCGAKLTYAPGTTRLMCQYCGAENEIQIDQESLKTALEEINYENFLAQGAPESQTQEIATLKCDACGAQTTFDENVVSDSCAFCGNTLTIKSGSTQKTIEPQALLPFHVKEQQGGELFKKWINSLWWAPNKLKHYARQGKLKGVYIPYWTYDSNTISDYHGQRGDDYQVEVEYEEDGETRTRTETRTRWSSVSGTVSNEFDDVLVPASTSLSQKHIEKLEPWDLENLIPYNNKFLSGFKAESYQVELKEGFDRATKKMEIVIRKTVKQDIGGDHQRIQSLNTSYNDVTFKHILLPIWISAYRYNQKVYKFMINGRTGEVQGERPYSWIKITLAVLLVALIIAAIIYFTY